MCRANSYSAPGSSLCVATPWQLGNFGETCSSVCNQQQLHCATDRALIQSFNSANQFETRGINCDVVYDSTSTGAPMVVYEGDENKYCYSQSGSQFDCNKSVKNNEKRICYCSEAAATVPVSNSPSTSPPLDSSPPPPAPATPTPTTVTPTPAPTTPTPTTATPPAPVTTVNGWRMGNFGESCTTVCSTHQLLCSSQFEENIQFQDEYFQILGVNCYEGKVYEALLSIAPIAENYYGINYCYKSPTNVRFNCDGAARFDQRRSCHCYLPPTPAPATSTPAPATTTFAPATSTPAPPPSTPTFCGAGKYSADASTVCTDCAAGKFSAAVGATAASTCAECAAGKYSAAAAWTCVLPAQVNTENVVAIACLEKQSGVIKPGVCSCIPSTGQSSGTFTSGDGVVVYMNERIETKKYLNGVECTWLISSPNEIRLSFTSFLTSKDLDFVTISSCTSSSCGNKTVLARLSGGPISSGQFTFSNARFTSSTGYLQVLFTSDGSGTQEGFIATWNTSLCTKPLHSAYISSELSWAADNCSWTCDDGYWRSGASCTSCTTSGCPAGEYRGACGTESDAACVVCDESKLPKYSHFISSADVHACAWACNVGYNIMGHVVCKSSVEPSINITTLPSKHLMEWDTTSVISVTLIVSFLPDADVVVRVSVSDQITLTGPSEITFTPLSWNVGQNITVMARNDWLREDNHSGFVTMAVSSVDDRFDGITVHPWTVMIQDNDCKALKTPTAKAFFASCPASLSHKSLYSKLH
jgi:hypothetical protein